MGSIGDDQSPSKSDDSVTGNKVKFLCSYGGKILPRPIDGHLRYVGGETRVVAVHRSISFADLMKKLGKLFDGNVQLKYQLPTEDLDVLVSVTCDEDLENMMDEHDRCEACKDGFFRLRAFLFPLKPTLIVLDSVGDQTVTLEQRYVDAVNGTRTISRLQVESPSGASPRGGGGGSPWKLQPDYLFGLESANVGQTEFESLSPTAPSDPSLLTPSPTQADSSNRRRNGPIKPSVISYVRDDGGKIDVLKLPNDDANYQPNSIRKVSSEGRMGSPNGSPSAPGPTVEPQEVLPTRFHRGKDNMVQVDGNQHRVTFDMHRVHSSPNLLQDQYAHTFSPTYGAKRIIRGGGGSIGRPEGLSATGKIGAPVYNNNISRTPGSILRYPMQKVMNLSPQIVYVDRPYSGNSDQCMRAVHVPLPHVSIPPGEEVLKNGGHHQYMRVVNNNCNTNHDHVEGEPR